MSVLADVAASLRDEAALRDALGLNTLILGSSDDCIVVLDLLGHTQFVSPGGIEAMEVDDVDAIRGLSWLRVWSGDDLVQAQAAVAEARAGRIGRFQGYCPTHKGKPKWWDVVVSPIVGADGMPERLVSIGRDITELRNAEAQLRESEERRRLTVESADIGTWDIDPATGSLEADARAKALFGLPANAQGTYQTFMDGLHPDDREPTQRAVDRALDPAGTGGYDTDYRTVGIGDGIERWVSARGRVRFENGKPVRFLGIVRDITEHKMADAQAQLLAEELQHRVKNTLAMVQAIVRQTLRHATNVMAVGDAIEARLAAMGRAYDMLTGSGWASTDLHKLIDAALLPHDDATGGRFRLAGPPVHLPAQAAMAMALVLHELATNAAKYGALSLPAGQVEIAWSVGDARAIGGSRSLHLTWREQGGPAVAEPTRRGFGSRLIERSLGTALGGTATLVFAPEGVVCAVQGTLQPT